jgi:hypothetical protein
MICQCGGIMRSSEHSIKSINKANEWANGLYQEKDLPLHVAQQVCISCGRLGYKITNVNGELIKSFNL